MNKVFITEKGSDLRNELITEQFTRHQSRAQILPPIIDSKDSGVNASPINLIDDGPAYRNSVLYRKTDSEKAMQSLAKKAKFSIQGKDGLKHLEAEMIKDLHLPPLQESNPYLKKKLEDYIRKMSNNKNTQETRKAVMLQVELSRLNKSICVTKSAQNFAQNEQSLVSTIEENGFQNKMKDIVHVEGKLSRMLQRHQRQKNSEDLLDKRLEQKYKSRIDQLNQVFEKIKPMSPTSMKQNTGQVLDGIHTDQTYRDRQIERVKAIQMARVEGYWKKHKFPEKKKVGQN